MDRMLYVYHIIATAVSEEDNMEAMVEIIPRNSIFTVFLVVFRYNPVRDSLLVTLQATQESGCYTRHFEVYFDGAGINGPVEVAQRLSTHLFWHNVYRCRHILNNRAVAQRELQSLVQEVTSGSPR